MRVVGILLILALGVTTWKVYSVRAQLSDHDADPAIVKRLEDGLQSIPLVLENGRYVGESLKLSDIMVEMSGADLHRSILYRDADRNTYQLYVGGAIRNEENFHSPSYCMPAASWEIVKESTVPFHAYPVDQECARMRRLELQRGNENMVVFFWFQAGRRVADHEWTIRWYRFLDLLAGEPLRPAVIVTVYANVQEDVPTTDEAVQEFISTVGPHLSEILSEGAS